MTRRWEGVLGLALVLPPTVVLVALILLPAVQALTFSLGLVPTDNIEFSGGQHTISTSNPTLAVYQQLLANHSIRNDISLTLSVTLLAVLGVAVVSYVLALYVRFGSGGLPQVVRSLYLVPMFVPVVIASYALATFYVDHGALNALVTKIGLGYDSPAYKQTGIVLGQIWYNIPFAVLMLGSGLDGIDQELVDSAHDVGAGFFAALWRIVLPLNFVPLLIVLTFTFIGVIGSFTIPFLLGPNAPQMLGVAIQAYFSSYNQPQPAVALGIITFGFALLAGVLYVWATSRNNRAAVAV